MQRLSDYSNLMLELNLRLKQRWEQRSRLTLRPKEKLLQRQKLILNLKEKVKEKVRPNLKLMLKQKLKLKLMSRVRQKPMLTLMPMLMRREKQINLNLVTWANPAATLILSITLVKKLLEEDIKLMSINGPITILEV